MDINVGALRQQSAFADSKTPLIVICDDEALKKLLDGIRLEVVEFYPDTTDGNGNWKSSFKIKVAIAKT